YEYNLFILMRTKMRSESRVAPGHHLVEVVTKYAEARPGGPLNVRISVDGQSVGGDRRTGQCAVAVHGERLPGHRHLPGFTGLARLLRPRTVPVRREHRQDDRRIHLNAALRAPYRLRAVDPPGAARSVS